jgi:hypothetical protein
MREEIQELKLLKKHAPEEFKLPCMEGNTWHSFASMAQKSSPLLVIDLMMTSSQQHKNCLNARKKYISRVFLHPLKLLEKTVKKSLY